MTGGLWRLRAVWLDTIWSREEVSSKDRDELDVGEHDLDGKGCKCHGCRENCEREEGEKRDEDEGCEGDCYESRHRKHRSSSEGARRLIEFRSYYRRRRDPMKREECLFITLLPVRNGTMALLAVAPCNYARSMNWRSRG